MEIYEQYSLSAESGLAKGNFLFAALILGDPLTGEWAYAQLVEDEMLKDLIGDKNTQKVIACLSEVKVSINARSQSDASSPAAPLFGNPWLLSLVEKYGDVLMLSEEIHIHAQGTGNAIINAYTNMAARMEESSDHECDDNHNHR